MRERSGKLSISGLAAALLLCVFALMILSVLLGGAGAYQRLTARGQESYDSRSCAQYVATKLRQAPSAESVELRSFGGAGFCIRRHARAVSHDGLEPSAAHLPQRWKNPNFFAKNSCILSKNVLYCIYNRWSVLC